MLANIIRNAKKTATGGTGGGIVTDSGDPYYSAVSLLLPMDGSNGSTTFTDSGPNAITLTATGSPQISTTLSKYGGASASFPTNQSYLTAPSSTLWAFGTGDFTIEFWIYIAANQNSQGIIGNRPNSAVSTAWQILFHTTNNRIEFHTGAAIVLQSSSTVSLNTWTHVAFCRSSGTLRVFLNGVQAGSVTNSNDYSTVSALNISRDLNTYASSNGIVGNLDDLRISKFARYTTSFTPPTAALPTFESATPADPYYGSTSLLLHMDGTNGSTSFVDSGPNALAVTASGNAQVSTAQSKFGGASAYFDGNGDYLSLGTQSQLDFGTGDFTIECWFQLTSTTNADQGILNDTRATFGTGSVLFKAKQTSGSGKICFQAYDFSSSGGRIVQSTTVPVVNTWYHVALVRSSGTVRLFVNGVLESSGTWAGSVNFNYNNGTRIGHSILDGANGYLTGYIDDLRITKGVARTITVPTKAFPNLYNPNTTLPVSGAALWLDASQQNTLFSDAGVTPVNTSGQSVYQWNDLSGNNRHAIQATSGNRPTWLPPASGQNGLGGISFNGSTAYMAGSWAAFDPLSIYVVFKWLNGYFAGAIFTQSDATTNDSTVSSSSENWMPMTITNSPSIPSLTYYYPASSTATGLTQGTGIAFSSASYARAIHKRNGTSLSSTINGGTAVTATMGNINRIMTRYGIGRRLLAANQGYVGVNYAEIIAFNSILSTTDENSVISYLQAKWGTP